MTRSWGWSAILYTIDFEYKGGTYLAQVEAFDPEEVLDLWTKQISDEELVRWKVDRSALIDALASETLIPVEGLVGVWCASSAIGGSFALANIVATDTTAPNARLDLTSTLSGLCSNSSGAEL